ncbi:crosslink repair DNA glycosylase YcaQ family protein [Nocardioides fonticola]|uniref:Crosslink repair DNA glycosylase YcaQ family protein n=1 Tax=Nocardioides fonticola TaxID=450363 RepID=A0ABP7XCT8_9ACTN
MLLLRRDDARRIAVRAQLLGGGPEPTLPTLPQMLHRLAGVQVDLTAAVARSADLVARARVPGFRSGELEDLADVREILEIAGFWRPAEDLALYAAEMARWPGDDAAPWQLERLSWLAANAEAHAGVLAQLAADGPTRPRDLDVRCARPWRSSGWTDGKDVQQLVELLLARGELAVAGRRGRDRLVDLAERVYPEVEAWPYEEALRERDRRRLAALGIARAQRPETPGEPDHVGDAGVPAVVEDVAGEWRVDPALLDAPPVEEDAVALLSPLDRLVMDRLRARELFGFDYRLEMYQPAAKRQWGYWAMPVLVGDRLVGKLDAAADRKDGVLRVHAVHRDADGPIEWPGAWVEAVDAAIDDLAAWLGLERVEA